MQCNRFSFYFYAFFVSNIVVNQSPVQASQAEVQMQTQQPQTQDNHPVTQQFYGQNYVDPFHVKSEVNHSIHLNTIGFLPALAQRRTWNTFDKPIKSIACSVDENMAVVWDNKRVSIGNKNSAALHVAEFPQNSYEFAKSTAFWQRNGDLSIQNHEHIVLHWPKESLQERFDSGRCAHTRATAITCSTYGPTNSFIGLADGSICMKDDNNHYPCLYTPKSPDHTQKTPAVRDIALIDDTHLAVIYENSDTLQLLDITHFNVKNYDWSRPEIEQEKIVRVPLRFEGVSCSAIAALSKKTLMLGSKDGMIRIIEQNDQNEWLIKAERRGAASAIKKIIPCDKCVIVIGEKDTAFYIRYLTGTLIYQSDAPKGARVIDVATFPDGSIAVAYSNRTVELLEIQTPAIQELQDAEKVQRNALQSLIGALTKLKFDGITPDAEHLGTENMATLKQLAPSIQNNLLLNYNCSDNFKTTGANDTPMYTKHQVKPSPERLGQNGILVPQKTPWQYFKLLISRNKFFTGLLITAALIVLTGKPIKIARRLRPIVKFPFTLFSYLRKSPSTNLQADSFIPRPLLP